jgi:hypothetical protein
MKNAYRKAMISVLAIALLWVTMATTFTSTVIQPHLVVTPSSPSLERVTSAQAGAYHRWSSEEIGRGMVPQVRNAQW